MRLQIESPHLESGEKLVQTIESRFFHLHIIYSRINHCDVVLRKENNSRQNDCSIEARMEVWGQMLFAKDRAESFESALKNVIDNLEHQLLKHKEGFSENNA